MPIGAAAAVATPGAAPVSRGPTTRSRSALASAAVATAGSSSDLAAAAAAANSGGGSSDGSEQLHGTLGDALLRLHGVDAAALLPPGTPLTPILAIGSNASPEQLVRTRRWRSLRACLHACMPACLPACLHACKQRPPRRSMPTRPPPELY